MEVSAGNDASPWPGSWTLRPSRPLPLGVLRLQPAQGQGSNPDTDVQKDLSPSQSPQGCRGLLLHRSWSLSFPRERQGAGLPTLCIVRASKKKKKKKPTPSFHDPQSYGTRLRPVGKEAYTLRPSVQLGSATVPSSSTHPNSARHRTRWTHSSPCDT